MKHLYFNPREGVVPVKQGFSWPAFLFGSLWAMAHHMWWPYVWLLLPVEACLALLAGLAQARGAPALAGAVLLANLVFAIVRGHWGNRWYAQSLRRRGYAENDALLLRP